MAVRELIENSFPFDEPILIRDNGRIELARIGELVERKLCSGPYLRVGERYYARLAEGIEVLTLDKDLKLTFKRVTAVFKHKSPRRLWRLTLQSGRTVRTTSAHNVFVLEDDLKVVSKETQSLKKGDSVIVPSSSDVSGNLCEIDILDESLRLEKDEAKKIVVHGIARTYPPRLSAAQVLLNTVIGETVSSDELQGKAASLGLRKPENLIHTLVRNGSLTISGRSLYKIESRLKGKRSYSIPKDWVHCDSVPLNHLRTTPPPNLLESQLSLSVKQGKSRLPRTIPATKELMRILGYYTSEGSISGDYKLTFSFGSHEMETYVKDLVACIRKVFGREPVITLEHTSAVNVVLNDASLVFLFDKIFKVGRRSGEKRVPWVVFNSPREYVEEYLTAYVRGDGHVQTTKRNKKITLATSSRDLFTGLKFLLTLAGRHYSCSFSPAKKRVVNGKKTTFDSSYYIYVRQGITPESCSLPIEQYRKELLTKSKTTNLYNERVQKDWLKANFAAEDLPESLRRIVFSDAGAIGIKRIERVGADSEWVYDISVDGVERFIGGEAIALLHNSLDATELAGVLPDVFVRIIPESSGVDAPDPRPYRLSVWDNGPGVDPQHVPSAFGKVFYGSKYILRQSRGMFGLGGTMTILYGQITSNKPVHVTTSADGKTKYAFEMLIDIAENRPVVLKRQSSDAGGATGTRVDLVLEGDYLRASQKIIEYLKETALVASYANLTFIDPQGQVTFFERATNTLPAPPKETLPHPYGIDVEAFKRIVKLSEEETLQDFMVKHFHRVGEKIATKFLAFAGMDPTQHPKKLNNLQVVAVVDALQRYPEFLQPDASCLSPVGEVILNAGIAKELQPEFSAVVTRPPSSYSGFPFLVEAGIAYGGKVLQQGVKLLRFANRIPLLYDESSDVSFKVLNEEIDWRRYHVPQDAPVAVITHICLPCFEKVLAIVNGEPRLCGIGSLVDEEIPLSTNKESRDGVSYVVPTREIFVPSLNPDTFKIEHVRVRRFMKRPGGSILKITTEEGRTANVSPDHPLLVMTANGVEVRRANEIVDRDYLIASKRIPRANEISEKKVLDLVDCFARSNLINKITVVGAKELLYQDVKLQLAHRLGVPVHQIDNWRRYDRVPLWAYLRMETDKSLRKGIRLLGSRSHGEPLPSSIELGKDMARILGFYLSEGCSNCKRNNVVSFSFHSNETAFHAEVIEILHRLFGVAPTMERKKRDKAVQITVYNKALALLFSNALGAGIDSNSKRVPDFVFSMRDEFIENLLDSYFAGDGYHYRPTRHVQASSSSEELIQGLFLLLKRLGLAASVNRYGRYYRLDLEGGGNLSTVRKVLPTVLSKKGLATEFIEYRPSTSERIPVIAFAKDGGYPSTLRQFVGGGFSENSRISTLVSERLGLLDERSRNLATGDIQCVRVRKVEVVDYHGYYYNVETDRELLPNYMHGFGIFSHNCSTKIPYKTVGKEYIADRPEIEREIRNAVREALRRLGIFLSRKGSMEAVQKKMNIYGKYLPLIAKFSAELAGQKRAPRYRKLIGEEPATTEPTQALAAEEANEPEAEPEEEMKVAQSKIEDYS